MLKQVLLVLLYCGVVTVRGQLPCLGAPPELPHSFAASSNWNDTCDAYVICMGGQEIHGQRCPANFNFEPISQMCVLESTCLDCSPFGIQNLPHPDNCNQFIECIMGVREFRTCPNSLLFDRRIGSCNYPHLVYCPGQGVDPTDPTYPTDSPTDETTDYTTTTEYTTVSPDPWPPTTPPPGGNLPDCRTGQIHHAHPTDCTRFFICINNIAIEQQCPNNLHWNQWVNTCDLQQYARCVIGGTTQPPYITTQPTTFDPPLQPPSTPLPLDSDIVREDESKPESPADMLRKLIVRRRNEKIPQ